MGRFAFALFPIHLGEQEDCAQNDQTRYLVVAEVGCRYCSHCVFGCNSLVGWGIATGKGAQGLQGSVGGSTDFRVEGGSVGTDRQAQEDSDACNGIAEGVGNELPDGGEAVVPFGWHAARDVQQVARIGEVLEEPHVKRMS